MTKMKYATAYEEKSMARAMGVALPISTKKTVEVCNFIRGRDISKAVRLLEGVVSGKVAVPFRRYAKGGTGHRPGIGPGRYPISVCSEILKLLHQAQANAKVRGLDSASLVIKAVVAKKGAHSWHYGRQRRRQMKRTHVEVVVMEATKDEKKTAGQKSGTAVKSDVTHTAKSDGK
nr:50S ribosomal protein L22P [uncultured archaeon]